MATTALFTADDLNALPGVSGVTTDEATAVEARTQAKTGDWQEHEGPQVLQTHAGR